MFCSQGDGEPNVQEPPAALTFMNAKVDISEYHNVAPVASRPPINVENLKAYIDHQKQDNCAEFKIEYNVSLYRLSTCNIHVYLARVGSDDYRQNIQ